jgi:DinB superfamily
MNPELARIRSYLQAQAASLTIPEIVGKVREAMAELRAAALAPTPAATSPAEGQWEPAQVLAHVVASGADVALGITGVIDTGLVPPRHDSGDEGAPASLPESLAALDADRERLFAHVLAATGDEHTTVTWPHPFFGDLNWREWLLFLRIHDLDHARQLRA